MQHQVRLLPTGHEFYAEEHESVLEAALRSGINLNYSCNNGSCGQCKARILSGQVRNHRHFDFVIPEAEKIQNHALLCSVSALSDLVIHAAEALNAQDIPHQNIMVKTSKLERLTEENLILHLRTPRSQTLRFLAGQHVDVKVGEFPPVSLAVGSCPCNGMVLQVHLQRELGNPVSEYFFNKLQIGEPLTIEGPYGQFTLDEESKRPIVLVAQDQGFAPIKSLIEHAIALDLTQSMCLFWLAGQGRRHYQANYCRAWEDALDCFVYHPLCLTKNEDRNDYAESLTYVISRCPIESEIDLYLAGPASMTEAFAREFAARGTPAARIFINERFS